MKWETISGLKANRFRRLTGVKRATFEKMIELISQALVQKKAQGGRPNKLSVEDMVLMTLEYLREYRTYFHISQSYGVSESSAYKTICWVEEVLVRSKAFALPGRKALLKSDVEYELVLMDATESPVERPKKSNATTIRVRKSGIH